MSVPRVVAASFLSLLLACAAPRPPAIDAAAVERVVRDFAGALDANRLDVAAGLFEPGARWANVAAPVAIDSMLADFRRWQSIGLRSEMRLRDFVVDGEGDVAWTSWMNDWTATAASEAAKALVRTYAGAGMGTIDSSRSEWRHTATFFESAVLAI